MDWFQESYSPCFLLHQTLLSNTKVGCCQMVFPTLSNSKVKWFRVHQTIWQEHNDRLRWTKRPKIKDKLQRNNPQVQLRPGSNTKSLQTKARTEKILTSWYHTSPIQSFSKQPIPKSMDSEILNTIETSAFTRVLNKLERAMQQVDLSISRTSKNTPAASKSGSPSLGLRCHEPRTARKEGLGISPVRIETEREFRCSSSFGLGFGALHKICLSITIVVSSATASVSVGQSTKGFFGQHLVSNISPKHGSWLFSSNLQLSGECHSTKGLSINSTWKMMIIIITNKACLFLSTMRFYVKLSWAQRAAGWMITANACHTKSCMMLQWLVERNAPISLLVVC